MKNKIFLSLILLGSLTLSGCVSINPQDLVGPSGPQGETGEPGQPGTPGKDGTNVLTGDGEPKDDIGSIGDVYIDKTTWNFYVKATDGWNLEGNIKGPKGDPGTPGEAGQPGTPGKDGQDGSQGPAGEDGKDGEPGSTILTGNGVPTSDLGKASDLYLDKITFDIYEKKDDGWHKIGNIKGDKGKDGQDYIREEHLVHFNTNCNYVILDQKVLHGEKIEEPIDPINLGYTFDGWYCMDEKWSFIGYVVTEDMTLDAKWKIDNYTLSYELDGGFIDESYVFTNSFNIESNFKLPIPTKLGYTFSYWLDEENNKTYSKNFNVTGDGDLKNTKLKAIYSVNSYDVNLNLDTAFGTTVGNGKHEYNKNVKISATINKGYVFDGWYDSQGKLVSKNIDYEFIMPAKNVTYNAKCKNDIFTVSVQSQEMTTGEINKIGTLTGSGDYEFKSSVTISVSNYGDQVFVGWFDGDELLTKSNSYTFNMPAGDITYTAKFKANGLVVAEVLNGQEKMGSVTGSGKYKAGEIITIQATPNYGYFFEKWVDENGNDLPHFTTSSFKYKVTAEISKFYCKFSLVPKNDITFEFGSYPQTRVTDSDLIVSLNFETRDLPSYSNKNGWSNFDEYYTPGRQFASKNWFKDFTYQDQKYRAVYLVDENYYPEYGYSSNAVYYFKFEPVEWISINDKGLATTKYILDGGKQPFNAAYDIDRPNEHMNDYTKSDIRKFINNKFAPTIFTPEELNRIADFNNDLNGNPIRDVNISDKMFLLSKYDVNKMKREYWKATSTDYAKCVSTYSTESGCLWETRTPYPDDNYNYVYRIGYDGNLASGNVNEYGNSIRPAIVFKNKI